MSCARALRRAETFTRAELVREVRETAGLAAGTSRFGFEAKPVEADRLLRLVAHYATSPAPSSPVALASVDYTGLLRLLIDTVEHYAIYLLDPSGHVTTWNTGAQLLEGYEACSSPSSPRRGSPAPASASRRCTAS